MATLLTPDPAPGASVGAAPSSVRLGVVVVNYRSAELVIAGLPALLAELAGFADGRVVVVDNASPGDDADRIAAHVAAAGCGDRVSLVRSAVNGGFSAGNNLGFAALRAAGGRFDAVLLLNPDAEPRPGALASLARVLAEQPQAGVVGARLENPDGTTWIAAFNFPTLASEFAHATGFVGLRRIWPPLAAETAAPARVDWVSGAAMMIRVEALDAIGGMDEGYFLYYEEIDFMHALGRAGWETWHVPDALVLHTPGSSTGIVDGQPRQGGMPAYWFASWRRYFLRNHGPVYARLAAAAKLAGLVIRVAQMRLRGRDPCLARGFVGDFARLCVLGLAPRAGRGG